MIIAFSWTTAALLSGAKTVTRRDWSESHARRFRTGMLVDAWDHGPRTGIGRKVAAIRLTRDPYRQRTSEMRDPGDYQREGFAWLDWQSHHINGQTCRQFFEDWRAADEFVWVVEFELVEVGARILAAEAAR